MNRRGFLRRILIASVAVPIAAPIVMKVAKEVATKPIGTWGYKGAQFMETGIVYAPYLRLYSTNEVFIHLQPMNLPTAKIFYKDFHSDYYKKETI
jgi:hypothetical protein